MLVVEVPSPCFSGALAPNKEADGASTGCLGPDYPKRRRESGAAVFSGCLPPKENPAFSPAFVPALLPNRPPVGAANIPLVLEVPELAPKFSPPAG